MDMRGSPQSKLIACYSGGFVTETSLSCRYALYSQRRRAIIDHLPPLNGIKFHLYLLNAFIIKGNLASNLANPKWQERSAIFIYADY